jgi:hypothetical protein
MFEGIATYIVGFFTLLALIIGASWRSAWVSSKQDSRLTAVELSQKELKGSLKEIHEFHTQLALLNQSMITMGREMKGVKDEIKSINKSLQLDKENHLRCSYYPKEK